MTRAKNQDMTINELVEQFVAIALAQDEALLVNEIRKYNRLFDDMETVEQELKLRTGDQRRVLRRLYDHPNAEVRLKAAKATLAVAPKAARRVLQTIRERQEFPQALDAGMTLGALDDGTFKPT